MWVGAMILGWTLSVGAVPEDGGLPRSAPEAEGVSSKGILAFVEAADREVDSLHSLMVVRHGRVVAEGWWAPYDAATPHELYSLSKSFTSTAVGLAVAEGRLSIDDPVLKFFPNAAPSEPSANLKAMRVRDLLCMSTGHQAEPPRVAGDMTVAGFLAHPVVFKPGTHFLYNTPATFMQAAIVETVTGQPLIEYLTPRLFQPLGITGATWSTNSEGHALGGYGLNVRTEDIARFGQLYLQKGRWKGRPLLPETWVDQATARQTSNGSNPASDWDQGYGFQFWRCRHGAYRGDGAFGQYCLVLPEQDAVVAMTAGLRDMQAVLNLVWEHLLPAMHPRRVRRDREAEARLHARLSGLTLKRPEGRSTSTVGEGLAAALYRFPANDRGWESLNLASAGAGQTVLRIRTRSGEQTLVCGAAGWERGRLTYGVGPAKDVATSGAWTAEDTFLARICFRETPYVADMTLTFTGDQVRVDTQFNVRIFSPAKEPTLVGTR